MNRMIALVLFGLLASAAHAQKPEPTLAQCEADKDAWLADVQKDIELTKLPWEELRRRSSEMSACEDVIVKAAENKVEKAMTMRPLDYRNVVYWYDQALLWRLENFLSRHNLSNQFAAEDHQGSR